MDLTQATLEEIKRFFSHKPVLKAYVFGSYATGTASSDSDIDILVELEAAHQLGLEFIQMKLDLEKLLHTEVDLVTEKAISPRLLTRINKTKKLIYAR